MDEIQLAMLRHAYAYSLSSMALIKASLEKMEASEREELKTLAREKLEQILDQQGDDLMDTVRQEAQENL